MSTVATPFDPCFIDYHKTMAATLSVGSAIERGSSILSLAKDFWILARDFKSLLTAIESVEKAPPEEINAIAPRLAELHKTTAKLLDMSGKRGLTNRTLISTSVQSIQSCNERLYDAIECFQMSLDPAISEAVRQALGEYERGETVSLDSLV